MFFRCGTKMSFKAVRKPHIKNRVVAIAIAVLSVEGGAVAATGIRGAAIAMQYRTSIWARSTVKSFQNDAAKVANEKTITGSPGCGVKLSRSVISENPTARI